MVLFVSSVVNPNGLEVAASLAFAASVLRVSRAPSDWPFLAACGSHWGRAVITILSWQLGPVFALADLALLPPAPASRASRPRQLPRPPSPADRQRGPRAGDCRVAWLRACLRGRTCSLRRQPVPRKHSYRAHAAPRGAARFSRDVWVTDGAVPNAARWIWWILVIVLCGVALWVGTLRERIVLGTTALLVFAISVCSTPGCIASPALDYGPGSAAGAGARPPTVGRVGLSPTDRVLLGRPTVCRGD